MMFLDRKSFGEDAVAFGDVPLTFFVFSKSPSVRLTLLSFIKAVKVVRIAGFSVVVVTLIIPVRLVGIAWHVTPLMNNKVKTHI